MNEMVKDPSPTKRLQRLGIRKATKKASAAIPAPKKLAMTISLKKPRMRLRRVPVPIMEAAFVILLCSDMEEILRLPILHLFILHKRLCRNRMNVRSEQTNGFQSLTHAIIKC
jgi:hypothetical protein